MEEGDYRALPLRNFLGSGFPMLYPIDFFNALNTIDFFNALHIHRQDSTDETG